MTARRPTRAELAFCAALAVAAWATRAAVRAHSPTTWDAGLFANGVRDYDVLAGQPHPPGYPLTIAAAKALLPFVGDPVAAMVWLNVLASGVAAALVGSLAWRLQGRAAAVVAGLAFVLSPVALYNGSVGLSYGVEAAASAGLALAVWHAAGTPSPRTWSLSGLAFAAAMGIRPSAVFFLAPLLLWPLRAGPWRARVRGAVWLGASAGVGILAWLVPEAILGAGSLGRLLAANRVQSSTVVFRDTILQGGWRVPLDNVQVLLGYAHRELAVLPWVTAALLALGWAAWWNGTTAPKPLAPGGTVAFTAWWILPALAFYVFVYAGWPVFPDGYLMVVLPGACIALGLLVGASLARAVSHAARAARALAAVGCVLLLVAAGGLAVQWPSAIQPIRAADAWAESWDGLEQAFPVDSTLLVTFTSWSFVKLREPDYTMWAALPFESAQGTQVEVLVSQHGHDEPGYYAGILQGGTPMHRIPSWVQRIVLHEGRPGDDQHTLVKASVALHSTTLPTGRQVRWFVPDGNWTAIESYFWWTDPVRTEAQLAASGR